MAINGIKSFRETELQKLREAVNNHADNLVQMYHGIQKILAEQEKQKGQIEALLAGQAQMQNEKANG